MKKTQTLSALALCFVAFSATAQPKSGSAKLETSEKIYKQIAAEAKKYGAKVFPGAEDTESFYEYLVDLNLDGVKDKIYVGSNSMWCGSGGCATETLLSDKGSFKAFDSGYQFFQAEDGMLYYSKAANGDISWTDKGKVVAIKVPAPAAGLKFSKLTGSIKTFEGAGCTIDALEPKKNPPMLGSNDYDMKGMIVNVNGKDELFAQLNYGEPITNYKGASGTLVIKEGKQLKCEYEECMKVQVDVEYKGSAGNVKVKATQTCSS